MAAASDPVSIAILILLMLISSALIGYVAMFIYARYKRAKGDEYQRYDLLHSSWLDSERKPLIPGNLHTRTVQPVLSDDIDDEDDEDDRLDAVDNFKERDYSRLGRIIFVMRYNKRREELMVRLVQIEGLPVNPQELYSPNSAYVDVQLKYTGQSTNSPDDEVHKPPRLDICLQQVYYFIISTQQMMSHSLEFQINTFDDQFRRFVSGIVEVNLCEELGDDILTENEVVFVKEILEPFRFSEEQQLEEDDFVSAVSEIDENKIVKEDKQSQQNEEEYREEEEDDDDEHKSRCSLASSHESVASNMSWEPEVSRDLLTISTNELFQRWSSEHDLLSSEVAMNNPLTQYKRSHSVGYLPTYEWTVREISFEDEDYNEPTSPSDTRNPTLQSSGRDVDYYKLYDDYTQEESSTAAQFARPPPESFYRIVPDTPLLPPENNSKQKHESVSSATGASSSNAARRVAYKKHTKRKHIGRSFSINKRSSSMKHKPTETKKLQKSGRALERSSSWPSLPLEETPSGSSEVSPVHHFFPESSFGR